MHGGAARGYRPGMETGLIAVGLGVAMQMALGGVLWIASILERRMPEPEPRANDSRAVPRVRPSARRMGRRGPGYAS